MSLASWLAWVMPRAMIGVAAILYVGLCLCAIGMPPYPRRRR